MPPHQPLHRLAQQVRVVCDAIFEYQLDLFNILGCGIAFRHDQVRRFADGDGECESLSIADKDTSPITRFFNVGLGGKGLTTSRSKDEFGLSYAYTDLSSVLKDNLNLVSVGLLRPRPEHQFEGFYNVHLTPWLRVLGDLQIIRGIRHRLDTALVPGARLLLIF